MVWSIGLLAVLIGLDQALKYWTVTHLALGESAELIPGFLQLTRRMPTPPASPASWN